MHTDDSLKLEKQLCFRLYSLSKLMNRRYTPVLKELSLTYPQYLVMLVLWEKKDESTSIKTLGQKLDLDSGTLSPLLKRMEKQLLITRIRNVKDERSVEVKLTKMGLKLKSKAKHIPAKMFKATGLLTQQLIDLNQQLDQLLLTMNN